MPEINKGTDVEHTIRELRKRSKTGIAGKNIIKGTRAVGNAAKAVVGAVADQAVKAVKKIDNKHYDEIKQLEEQLKEMEQSPLEKVDAKLNTIEEESDKDYKRMYEARLALVNDGFGRYKEFHAIGQYSGNKIDNDTSNAKEREDQKIGHFNETIGWHNRTTLEQVDAFRISDTPEFIEANGLANKGIAREQEIKEMHDDVKRFEQLLNLIASKEVTDGQADEAKKFATYINAIDPATQTSLSEEMRWLGLKNYTQRVIQRVTELESLSAKVEKDRKILKKHIGKAEQRLTESTTRFEDAKTRYETVQKLIREHDQRLNDLEEHEKVTDEKVIEENKLRRLNEAKKRAEEADKRVEEADKRVEEADKRLNAAKKLGKGIEAAQEAKEAATVSAESAKNIKKLELFIVESIENGNDIKFEREQLSSIKDLLKKEEESLGKEKAIIENQKSKINQEKEHLEIIYGQELTLAVDLHKSLEAQKKSKELLTEIYQSLEKKESILDKKNKINAHLQNIIEFEKAISGTIGKMNKNIEENKSKSQIIEAITNNSIHMEINKESYFQQAKQKLDALLKRIAQENLQIRCKETEGFLLIDPYTGRMGVNGIWFEIRKINKMLSDGPDRTKLEYRPDIVAITVSRQARDSGAIKLQDVYTKNLWEKEIDNNEYFLKLEVNEDNRKEGVLTFINYEKQKKERGEAEKEGRSVIEERYKVIRRFDMEKTKDISLMIDLNNEKERVPGLSFDFTTEIMPNPILEHDKTRKADGTPGLEDHVLRRMWRIHLPSREVYLPTGKTIKLDELDWTETKFAKHFGLAIAHKGPAEFILTNLAMAGSNLSVDMDAERNLIDEEIKYRFKRIDRLKSAFESGDEKTIFKAFQHVEKCDALTKAIIPILKKEFESPPKDRWQYETKQKRIREGIIKARLAKFKKDFSEGVTEIYEARKGHDGELQRRLRALPSISDKNRKKYVLGIEARRQLLKDLTAAWHLDETFKVDILENPTVATAFIGKLAKEAGEAKKIIEKIQNGESDAKAIEAQNKVEDEIFDKINQAFVTYRKDRSENATEAEEAFHASIRETIQSISELQVKAIVAEAAQDLAKITSVSAHADLVKDTLEKLEKEIEAAKKSGEHESAEKQATAGVIAALHFATMQTEQLGVASAKFAASKAQGKNDSEASRDAYDEIKDLEKRAKSIRKQGIPVTSATPAPERGHFAIDVNDGHITLGNQDDANARFYLQDIQGHEQEQYDGAYIDGAYEITFKNQIQNRAGNRVSNPFPVAFWYLSNNDQAARQDWATKTYIHFEHEVTVNGVQERGMLYMPNDMAVPLSYIDWGKTEQSKTDGITITLKDEALVPDELRGQKINLKAAAEEGMTLEKQNEAAVKMTIREASKKRAMAQALKDYADSERIIAEAQGRSPNIAVTEAIATLNRDADNAANAIANQLKRDDVNDHGLRGDFDESAARLDLLQRRASAHKRLAQSVKDAAESAGVTALTLGESSTPARKTAAYMVTGFAKIAEQSAKGAGKDGLEAAVIAAENAAANLVAVAKLQRDALYAARESGKSAGMEQEENALRVVERIKSARSNVGNDIIKDLQEKSINAAQIYANLMGRSVNDTVGDINAKIDQITNGDIGDASQYFGIIKSIDDEKERNFVKDVAIATSVSQLAMIEQATLDAVIAAQNIAQEITQDVEQQREEARGILDDLDSIDLSTDRVATVIEFKEYAALLQAKAKAAQAEKRIVRETGGDEEAQTEAVNQILGTNLPHGQVGTIDRIMNQEGLVAAVRYAESRAQVADAVMGAARAARNSAAPGNEAASARAAAERVRDQSQAIRDRYPDDSFKRDIESAVGAKKAAGDPDPEATTRQNITNAIEQTQMIPELARADEVAVQMSNAQINTVKRIADAEVETAALIEEAPDQQTKQDILKAHKEAAIHFQARAKVVKYTQDIQRAIGADDQQRETAVENATRTFDDRFKQGGLVAAVRYAESRAQIAKAIESLRDIPAVKAVNNAVDAVKDLNTARFASNNAVNNTVDNAVTALRNTETTLRNAIGAVDTAVNDLRNDPNQHENNKNEILADLNNLNRFVNEYVDRAVDTLNNAVENNVNVLDNSNHLSNSLNEATNRAEGIVDRLKNLYNLSGIEANVYNYARQQNPGDPTAEDIEAAACAAYWACSRGAVRAGVTPESEALRAKQAIIDAANQPYNLTEYHGDRDEEYKVSIKAARYVLMSKKTKIDLNRESVKKAGIAASDSVRESAAKVSQDLMRQVEAARKSESDQGRDPNAVRTDGKTFAQDFSQKQLADIRLRADESVKESAEAIANLRYENENTRKKYTKGIEKELQDIVHNAERISQIRGGDSIAQDLAKAEAMTSYAAYLDKLAKAADTASREAAAIANLAGEDAQLYGSQAVRAVMLRANNARQEATLQGKDTIDQYAAAAAGAAEFAQDQVELKLLAEAAANAAVDRAKAENLTKENQEEAKKDAARDVIRAFKDARIKVAKAKIEQAKEDGAIFTRETAVICGKSSADVQAKVDAYRSRVEEVHERNLGENDPTRAEAVAQAAINRAARARAFRDIVRAGLNILATDGMPRGPQRQAGVNKILIDAQKIVKDMKEVKIEDQGEEDGFILIRKRKSGYTDAVKTEAATQLAEQWRAIENAFNAAMFIANKAGGTIGDARNIKDQITNAIQDEELGPRNELIRYKLATQVAIQHAVVQNSRLVAAINREKAVRLATLPNQDILPEIGAFVNRIDRNIPPLTTTVTKRAYQSLQEAAFEAKITQAAEMSAQKAQEVAGRVALGDPAARGREAARFTLNGADQILNGNREQLEDALIAALRAADAYNEIAKYADEAEKHAIYSARAAGHNQDDQVRAGQAAVARLFNAFNPELYDALGVDIVGGLDATEVRRVRFLRAVNAAKKYAASEAEIAKAVRQVYENDPRDVQDLLDHVNQIRIAAPIAEDAPIVAAGAAAQAAENIIGGRAVDNNNNVANNKRLASEQAVRDAGGAPVLEFDGNVAKHKADFARTLDDIKAVASNVDVLQAINDAGLSAYAAIQQRCQDINNANAQDIIQMYDEYNRASQAVLRPALDARKLAKSAELSDSATKYLEKAYSSSTAARFVSKHAVAISAREMAIESMGNPDAIQAEVEGALTNLNNTLARQAERKAGLQVDQNNNGALILNPNVAGDSLIDEARGVIRQVMNALGQSADQQMEAAKDFEETLINAANDVKRDVMGATADVTEATIAAVAFIEWQVEIERARKDAIFAAVETAELTGEKHPEKLKEVAQAVYDSLDNEYQAARQAARDQGLDEAAEIAVGAVKARQIAKFKQKERDAAITAKASAGLDKTAQIETAKKAVEDFRKDASADKEVQESFVPTVLATIAKDATRYAIAQAKFAQVVKAIAPHAETRRDQLAAITVAGGAVSRDEATQLAIRNMRDLVATTQIAGADPVTALEKGVAKATEYVVQFAGTDVIKNPTVFTEAKGVAALAQQYVSKGAERGTTIEDAGATDFAHVLHSSAEARIEIAENIAKNDIIELNRLLQINNPNHNELVQENQKEIESAAEAAKAESKARGEDEAQQETAAIEAATRVASDKVAFVREVKKSLDSIKDGTQVLSLDLNQERQILLQDIRNKAVNKRNDVLEAELETAKKKALDDIIGAGADLLGEITPHDVNGLTQPNALILELCGDNNSTAEREINEAAENARVAAAAQNKDLITQHMEAIAAARSQGAIISAKIKYLARMEQVYHAAGWVDPALMDVDRRNSWKERIDVIARQAKEGLDVIQGHIAAAAAVQKCASLREQFSQAIRTIPVGRGQLYNSAMRQSQIVSQLGPGDIMFQEIAVLDYTKREALRLQHPAEPEANLDAAAREALQRAEQAGEQMTESILASLDQIRDKANKAFLDGARQQAERGELFGQTLKAVDKLAREAADAAGKSPDNYAKEFANWVREIYQLADTEALRQAAITLPKLAKGIEAVAKASKDIEALAYHNEKTTDIVKKNVDSLLDEFKAKRAAVKAGGKDLVTELTAGGEAAAQFAATIVALHGDIENLANQIQGDIARIGGTDEQKKQETIKAIVLVLDRVDQARAENRAANKDFSLHEQVVVTREASLEARTDAIFSGKKIDETVTQVIKEIDTTYSSAPKLPALNGRQLIELYNNYAMKSELSPAERDTLKAINDFIDDKTNELHSNDRIELNIIRALAAANSGLFRKAQDGTRGAYDYIALLELGPKPDNNASELERLRFELVEKVYNRVTEGVARVIPQGSSNIDDLIVPILTVAKQTLETSASNLKLGLKACDPETPSKESKQLIDQMIIDETPWPGLGSEKDEQAQAKDVASKPSSHAKEYLKKTPEEMQLDALTRSNELFKQSVDSVINTIDAIEDTELKALFKKEIVRIALEACKQAVDLYKREDAKKYEMQKIEMWDVKVDKWWRRYIFEKLMFLWLQNGATATNRGLTDAEKEMVNILKKAFL